MDKLATLAARFWDWLWTVITQFWGWLGFLSNVVWVIAGTIPPANTWFSEHLGPSNDRWFLIGGLVALLVSSFLAWNAKQEEVEKQQTEMRRFTNPQIVLAFEPRAPYVLKETAKIGVPTPTQQFTQHNIRGNYVRVLATTLSRVNNCQARLSAIYRWNGVDWDLTVFNIPKELSWAEIHERGDRTTTLLANEDRFVDVAFLFEPENIIRVATFRGTPPLFQDAERIPNSAIQMFDDAPDNIYRLDVRVIGEPYADAEIKIAVQRGTKFDEVRTQQLREDYQYRPRVDAEGRLSTP